MHIYVDSLHYGTFFLKLSCHKSLYSSHQKREENKNVYLCIQKNISLIIVATCRQVFALNDSWTGIQSSSLLVTYFAYVGFIVASS